MVFNHWTMLYKQHHIDANTSFLEDGPNKHFPSKSSQDNYNGYGSCGSFAQGLKVPQIIWNKSPHPSTSGVFSLNILLGTLDTVCKKPPAHIVLQPNNSCELSEMDIYCCNISLKEQIIIFLIITQGIGIGVGYIFLCSV